MAGAMARFLFAETHPKRLGRELTPECCIEDVDARLEISPKECLSVCGPRWSCHARRGFAFCHPVGSAVRAVCVIQASLGTRRVHRQELRASAAVVFEPGFGVVQEIASRQSEKDARVRGHLAPEVQPIYSGYYIWRGAPNEPDHSPDTRTQLGVGIETTKLLQTPRA
jgi:hypothetical protein